MRALIAARNLRGKTGVSAIVLQHIAELRKRGYAVDVVGEKLDRHLVEAAGGHPIKLKRLFGPRYAARLWFAQRVSRLAARNDYNLVIGNSELLEQDVLFVHNLAEKEREVIPDSDGKGLRSKIRFDRTMYKAKNFRVCIANSNLTRADLTARYNIAEDKIAVVHPGYDPAIFNRNDRTAERARLRPELCPDECILLGFITSGHFTKRGADIMASTLAKLDQGLLQKLRILAIGSDKNTDSLRQMLNQHGIGELLISRDKTAEIAPYYHATDLLFYPARLEEFGLVILEAIACGTPVLTSKAVGAAELFATDTTAPFPDADVFANQLRELINSPMQLKEMAELQFAAAGNQTWSRYFDQLFATYATLA